MSNSIKIHFFISNCFKYYCRQLEHEYQLHVNIKDKLIMAHNVSHEENNITLTLFLIYIYIYLKAQKVSSDLFLQIY